MDPSQPPPYHDWTVIPDTALLPPPPSFSYKTSPATNASNDDADRAHAWTDLNPLWPPRQLDRSAHQALSIGFSSLIRPSEFIGSLEPNREHTGRWQVQSSKRCTDACFLSSLPLYSPTYGDTTIVRYAYFEVRVGELDTDAAIAIGFVAPPYPTWRMPGWERASLGVHGDDGRRFVNDTWGGRDFAQPFKEGETVGIGMKFMTPREVLPSYNKAGNSQNDHAGSTSMHQVFNSEIFFTRNGEKQGTWDLHEEVDADMDQPGGVTGLEGDRDIHGAIGVFGAATFEVIFGRHNWKYKITEAT